MKQAIKGVRMPDIFLRGWCKPRQGWRLSGLQVDRNTTPNEFSFFPSSSGGVEACSVTATYRNICKAEILCQDVADHYFVYFVCEKLPDKNNYNFLDRPLFISMRSGP